MAKKLHCNLMCPTLGLYFSNTRFHIFMFVLPMEGADIILGLALLRTLGPILADFAIPQSNMDTDPKSSKKHDPRLDLRLMPKIILANSERVDGIEKALMF